MLFKALLFYCLFHVVQSGNWKRIATDRCVGARGNNYKEFAYYGSSTFIIAMKLVHRRGRIGCAPWARTNWGCTSQYETNMIVTDTKNKRMYPHPALANLRTNGWYDLPGYGRNSAELVFSDPGFRYLYYGQRIRIWYGEDLLGASEINNYGYTCMDVYVYIANI